MAECSMQRFLDIVFSTAALFVLSPVLVATGIILRFTGEGHIFYLQKRVGQHQRSFELLKFATMLKDSPNMGTGDITVSNDPRVLPFGKFLRKTKINELPQLLNVIKGDMSLVGPRPLTEKNYNTYSPEVRSVIQTVKPGLTGIGSIIFRNEESLMVGEIDPVGFYERDIAPYKGRVECWYCQNVSLGLYFRIILKTVKVVLLGASGVPKFSNDFPEPSNALAIKLRLTFSNNN